MYLLLWIFALVRIDCSAFPSQVLHDAHKCSTLRPLGDLHDEIVK